MFDLKVIVKNAPFEPGGHIDGFWSTVTAPLALASLFLWHCVELSKLISKRYYLSPLVGHEQR